MTVARFGMVFGVLVDFGVGQLDRFLEPVGELLRRAFVVRAPHVGEVAIDGLGGHGAGDFAGRVAADPVTDAEQRPLGAEVVLAHFGLE